AAVEHDGFRLMALDTEYGGLPADTIDFVVARPARLPQDEPGQTGRCEVGYYIENDPDTEVAWLLRREDSTLDDDPLEGGAVLLAGPYVASLNIQFYDGLEWQAGWSEDEFPVAVNINILVVDENEFENPMAFGTTIPIMAR
ncbi:MAG: hypothetical protein JXR94_12780, partial [Candidatus Hydrogenedentes bacterium]|nr:hypothetical protein [Candidatus Hydrogenedentota bacterium]